MNNHKILMLEHDVDDQLITRTFFNQGEYRPDLKFVEYKKDFFEYLNNALKGKEQMPALILLSMNSVPVNAAGILQELRGLKEFRHIPVVVLSGTTNAERIQECYLLGACSVIIKPDNEKETSLKISTFLQYWFKTVQLPLS